MAYSKILRRLREEKTNYKKRGTMLMGKRNFITVNITNENTQVQILKPAIRGDLVIASAHSRYLLGKGWNGFTEEHSCRISDGLHGRQEGAGQRL